MAAAPARWCTSAGGVQTSTTRTIIPNISVEEPFISSESDQGFCEYDHVTFKHSRARQEANLWGWHIDVASIQENK